MTTPISLPFYLDCDTGIDDALALAYLLASPQADVRGIGTVSGNVSAAVGARNTLDLLQLVPFTAVRRTSTAPTESAKSHWRRPTPSWRPRPRRRCWCGSRTNTPASCGSWPSGR
jgi:hypothetical protein